MITKPFLEILSGVQIHIRPNSHVSENADDEKNLYPGSRKFIFLINLINLFKKSLHLKEPHLFFYKQLGQASALKVTYIFKFFGDQSCLMIV